MSFEFKETLTITVPDVEEQISSFSESDYKENHGLVIEVAAIHEGLTANYNYYSAEQLEAALATWVNPYGKPIIKNHDPSTESIGRVIAARMEREPDGTPYTLLQAAITDPDAITKILDKRYLTGSVGGKAQEALCSICGSDWAKASAATGVPCRHRRGSTYKGKLAYMEMNGIGFKEYSIVNIPADDNSSIRRIKTPGEVAATESDDNWVRPARIFSINMNQEEIVEFSESQGRSNVLENLNRKEAAPVYMQLKGAFLSALASDFSESDETQKKDKDVNIDSQEELNVNDEQQFEDDDILAVSEQLSSDLADSSAEEAEEVDAEEEEQSEEVVEEEETSETDTEENESDNEENASEDEESEEDAQEEDAEASVEETEEEEEASAEESEEDGDESVSEDEQVEEENVEEDEDSDTELIEQVNSLESRVEELEASNASLLEENNKLKGLLKQNLAERVVDAKIDRGLVATEERADALEEHVGRTASSLADSLRDLAKTPKTRSSVTEMPTVEQNSGAVDEGDSSVVVDGDEVEEQETKDPVKFAEDVLVDRLMDRRKF